MKLLPCLFSGLLFGALLFVAQGPAFAKKEKDSGNADKPPFQEVFKKLDAEVRVALKKDKTEGIKELERVGKMLSKDYPEEFMPYAMLSAVARMTSDQGKSLKILKQLSKLPTSDPKIARIAGQAKGQLKKMEALGKPLDMKFKALDGSKVDLAKMKGKVVLIDFWATWCGPCVKEIPSVKKTYDALHKDGFEIIGVSLDSDKKKLDDFLAKNDMPWPQFFDGKGWKTSLAQEHGISSIPAMWLVDKEGNLVDQNARSGLEEKVKKYLAK
jgi:thiol-disulfide isomerase/thioredoxin